MSINNNLHNSLYQTIAKQVNEAKQSKEALAYCITMLTQINLLIENDIQELKTIEDELTLVLQDETKTLHYPFNLKDYENCVESYELLNNLKDILLAFQDIEEVPVISQYFDNLDELWELYFEISMLLATINSKQSILKAS